MKQFSYHRATVARNQSDRELPLQQSSHFSPWRLLTCSMERIFSSSLIAVGWKRERERERRGSSKKTQDLHCCTYDAVEAHWFSWQSFNFDALYFTFAVFCLYSVAFGSCQSSAYYYFFTISVSPSTYIFCFCLLVLVRWFSGLIPLETRRAPCRFFSLT